MAALQKADVIHVPGNVGEKFTDMVTALAMPLEFPGRGQQVAGVGKSDARLVEGQRFAMITLQQRLVVEGVEMRRTALHEEKNDALGPRPKMRPFRRQRIFRPRLLLQHRRKGNGTEAQGRLFQHIAPSHHFRYKNSLAEITAWQSACQAIN
jgi:hypothetical protein